jgi:uncharacterized protein DUF3515
MVDLETPPARTPDRTTRSAALWATAIALPIAVLAGLLIFARLTPGDPPAARPAASTPAAVPSTPVPMTAPRLTATTARTCLALTSQLPATVRGLPGRRVTAGPEQNAAYGEPPITVACGAPQPTMCERADGGHAGCVPLDVVLLQMNGVCWWGVNGPATDSFTTMDRAVAVRVTVPTSYDKTPEWANEFSDAVVQTVQSRTAGVPSGCR